MFTRTGPYATSTAWNERASRIDGLDRLDRAEWTDEELDFASHLAAARRAMRAEQMEAAVGEGGPVVLEAYCSNGGLAAHFPLSPNAGRITPKATRSGHLSTTDVWRVVGVDDVDADRAFH